MIVPIRKPWLACRVSCYRPFEHLAFAHLRDVGVDWVELHAPARDQVSDTRHELGRHSLRVSMVQARAFLKDESFVADVAAQVEVAHELGAQRVLLCVTSDNLPASVVAERLRRAGDVAAKRNVLLAIETHPDLVHNAATALRTMQAVDHSHVRLNFDPANIYYYNSGLDPLSEYEKIAQWVVAVHLKDSPGGYQERVFPALGKGVVDFRELLAAEGRAGFAGPNTIEIEAPAGAPSTEAEVCARVAASVQFIREVTKHAG